MTAEAVAPESLHAWAVYLQASEGARCRGDRRVGTDHILLALLESPSIEALLGVSLLQARRAHESLDREVSPTWAWVREPTLPHCRCAPCRSSRGSGTSRKRTAFA